MLWVLGAVCLLVVGRTAGSGQHSLFCAFSAAMGGLAALGAVNVLAPYTAVSLPLNWFTAFVGVVLGLPGVILLLVLHLLGL